VKHVFAEASWYDTDYFVTLSLPVASGTRGKDLRVDLKVQSVHVANRSTNTILLDREFNLAIDPEHEDNDWVLEPAAEAEGKPVLKITVRKAEERQGWSCLFKGDKFRQGYSTYSDDSKYQWVQSDEDVTATFALPEGVDQSSLTVDVKAQHLCIKARGHRPLIDAPLRFPVKVCDTMWSICGSQLEVILAKRERAQAWVSLTADGPEVAPQSALAQMIQEPTSEPVKSFDELSPEGKYMVGVYQELEEARAQNDQRAIAAAEAELKQLTFGLQVR
jgi:hypothetical protein